MELFIHHIIRTLPSALLIFPIVWFIRRDDLVLQRLGFAWVAVGVIATAVISTLARYVATFVFGIPALGSLEGGLGALFSLGVPIVISIIVIEYFKGRNNY